MFKRSYRPCLLGAGALALMVGCVSLKNQKELENYSFWEHIPQKAYFVYVQNQSHAPKMAQSVEKMFDYYYKNLLNSNSDGKFFQDLLETYKISKEDFIAFF